MEIWSELLYDVKLLGSRSVMAYKLELLLRIELGPLDDCALLSSSLMCAVSIVLKRLKIQIWHVA